MKSILPIIIFIFFSLFGFSQSSEIHNEIKINQVDSLGLKQGKWIIKEKIKYIGIHTDFSPNQRDENEYRYLIKSTGFYKNSKKIGRWLYFNNTNYTLDVNPTSITYLSNDTLIINSKTILGVFYELKTNIDTSFIDGKVFLPVDTIYVKCFNNECFFTTSRGDQIHTFNQSKFENEFYSLTIGMLNREIILSLSEK